MRKRVALFANGWSSEFLQEIGQGICLVAARANVDVFAFVNYTIHAETEENRIGEFNMFKLPDLNQFDGVIVMANTFNMQIEIDYVHKKILESGIPSISLEYQLDGIDTYGTDDYSGMHDLAEHMFVDHMVKDVLFIAGLPSHEGSNIRLKAVLDAAKEHEVNIPDDNIIYGNFSAAPSVEAFKKWFDIHKKLPEAIICANDIMAVGICDWLNDNGYSIPEDVKVTGFDCLKVARDYEPSITSVNREWITMGTRSMESLLHKMEGKEVPHYEEISTSFVCGESCGCSFEDIRSLKVHRATNTRKHIDGFSCDQHFRHMYIAMRKTHTAEQLNKSLSDFFIKEGWLEGDQISIAFHPNFFISDSWESIKREGFPDEMDVVCYVHDKKSEPIKRIKTHDVLFSMAENSSQPGIYICVPVRVDEISLGFAVLTRGFGIFQNDILYLWSRHMSQYTEQVKSNVMINQLTKRLEALSVTDGLTGIYNRTGCETIMYPSIVTNQQKGGKSVVMIADLDRLKNINDTYGHGMGDVALCSAVRALKDALPNSYMIGRYGGDEFLIMGCEHSKVNLEKIVSRIEQRLSDEADRQKVQFKLGLSIGAIQLEKGETFSIIECIQKADERMYKIKDMHHMNE